MESSCEKLCPDCPNRRGIAKVMGKLTMWWVDKTLGMHKIDRGDCGGSVPAHMGSTGHRYYDGKMEWNQSWMRVCPVDVIEVRTPAPEDVVLAFQANPNMDHFVKRTVTQLAPLVVEQNTL